jgi:hypothetical protein
MSLLIDTDAFCKLGIAGLIDEAAAVMGVPLSECFRLAALTHMLRRGSLPRQYGRDACEALIPVADRMAILGVVSASWLDRLTGIESIDPGEALLFAAAAEQSCLVLSGDKRAIRSVKNVAGMPAGLDGRVCILEAVLLALCERLGPEEVRMRVGPTAEVDVMVRTCFSMGTGDPREGLRSYYASAVAELQPLSLWKPEMAGV